MSRRLNDNISSKYLEAANKLNSKKSRRRIVAFVESYDDVFFWRTALAPFENDKFYFEIMLPTKGEALGRGKKTVIMSLLAGRVGRDMIACVDADYDYLLAGKTESSRQIVDNPYVFHTYVYSIENYQCYAQSLHTVCVMVTLNDRKVFDFVEFLTRFSEIIFPLFVWSIWHYRRGIYGQFTITDLNRIMELGAFSTREPQAALENLHRKVNRRIMQFHQQYPDAKESYLELKKELTEKYGITPQTTYLYIQGHHLFDKIIVPLVKRVCDRLRQERENEISRQALHGTQRNNELSCYIHSIESVESMLKKNVGYTVSPPFRQLQHDIEQFMNNHEAGEKKDEKNDEPKE